MTKIVAEFPPNIAQLRAAFTLSGREIFAWDGTIYNPGGGDLSRALVEHEKVHFRQQDEAGGPQAWWDRYLVDPEWRLEQEMEATIREYVVYSEDNNRKARRVYLDFLASRLASPMYGGVITKHAARARIKRSAR